MNRYAEEYRRSLDAPEDFWREQAREIDWFEFPKTILDRDANGAWRWFRGGKLNTAWLALDRHVAAGRGDLLDDRQGLASGWTARCPAP